MSSKNDETSGIAIAFGLIAAGIMLLAMAIFAIAAFFSLILTIISLWAWDKPRKLGGTTIEPHEAHVFVYSGMAGMVVLPVFVGFCTILFNFDIVDEYWTYLVIGGYVAGSLGVSYLMAQAAEAEAANQVIQSAIVDAPPRSERLIAPQPRPFEFATWDDEDATK